MTRYTLIDDKPREDKDKIRKQLQEDVEAFLAKGGEINKIACGVSADFREIKAVKTTEI